MANTALITGASSGIGCEFARLHAAAGGDVVLLARRETPLKHLQVELQAAYGITATVLVADLAVEDAAKDIVAQLAAAGIEIDVLINNAGFGGRGLFTERDWQADRAMIQVDIIAPAQLMRLLLPPMMARGHGHVLNVSSTAALMPGPWQAVYHASKAFLASLSNAVDEEVRGTGVTITNLMPGATATGFAAASGMDKTHIFDAATPPDKVAKAGYQAMLAGKLDVRAGLPFFMAAFMRCIPFMSKRFVMRQIKKMVANGD